MELYLVVCVCIQKIKRASTMSSFLASALARLVSVELTGWPRGCRDHRSLTIDSPHINNLDERARGSFIDNGHCLVQQS